MLLPLQGARRGLPPLPLDMLAGHAVSGLKACGDRVALRTVAAGFNLRPGADVLGPRVPDRRGWFAGWRGSSSRVAGARPGLAGVAGGWLRVIDCISRVSGVVTRRNRREIARIPRCVRPEGAGFRPASCCAQMEYNQITFSEYFY